MPFSRRCFEVCYISWYLSVVPKKDDDAKIRYCLNEVSWLREYLFTKVGKKVDIMFEISNNVSGFNSK